MTVARAYQHGPCLLVGIAILNGTFGCQRPHPAAPTPNGANVDFDELIAVARRYDLPMPPRDAPLVLAYTGTWGLSGKSPKNRPSFYTPAFLLSRLPDGASRVLMGAETLDVQGNSDEIPGTRPFSLQSPPQSPDFFILSTNSLETLVTCIQLAERGDAARATALFNTVPVEDWSCSDANQNEMNALPKDPRNLLAFFIYVQHRKQICSGSSDLTVIAARLARIEAEFPGLFAAGEDDDYGPERRQLIRNLESTIAAPIPIPGSVEAILIEIGQRAHDPNKLFPDEKELELRQKAFDHRLDALHDLLRLRGDRRLTRHCWMHSEPQNIGDVADSLLDELRGSQSVDVAGQFGAGREAERRFFMQAAFTREGDRLVAGHATPLSILGKYHPDLLLEVCLDFSEASVSAHATHCIAWAVEGSTLSEEKKQKVLVDLVERIRNVERRQPVLEALASVSPSLCKSLLRPALASYPVDVDGEYNHCDAARYSDIVLALDDVDVWREYLRATRLASVGLRMEMLSLLSVDCNDDATNPRRLAFFAAFLDDHAIRDLSQHPEKYEGPCAAFTFDTIEVRNFAAMCIDSLLIEDINPVPDQEWTSADWERYRNTIQFQLARRGIQPMREP